MNVSLFQMRIDKLSRVIRSPRLLRALLLNRVFAGAEHHHILVENLEIVVDIGANRGQFTLAAREWAPQASVIAFEPLPEAAGKFREVMRGNLKVIIHQAAIGPEAGQTTIHVSASDDSSSLLSFLPLQNQLFPGTNEIRTESVMIAPLSNFVLPEQIVPPAMLKIDVQGYELEALRGCEELLFRFDYVYVECSFVELYSGQALADDIIAWLQKRGWCLIGIYNMTYDRKGRSIQADFLFENSCLRRSA